MRTKFIFILFFLSILASAQQKPSQQWLDQKYSMFIHFGLYSQYGGVYMDKPVEWGYSEQIQSFAGIFSDWYAEVANEFNPVKWNPDSIVALAKEAGMRSIVFTSKHHDGFCMYHSKYTDFNIVDATPYGRDLMKELSEACRRGGIDFSVYFSLIDWHFPQAYPISSHNTDPLTPEHFDYNLKQVEEIMTNYGPISEIWFDMGSLTKEQSLGLYKLVNRIQPQCMISGRLGNDYGDFCVMADNEYPEYKMGVPWQTAASFFDETWGYRSWQERGDLQAKVTEKIESLIKVIGRGGNYLLNIGPKGDGTVVDFERDALLKIGEWVDKNKEAIYGSKANPFEQTYEWGDITTKDGCLYLFITKMPGNKRIEISGFSGDIASVKLIGEQKECLFYQNKEKLGIPLLQLSENDIISVPVLKVEFRDGYTVLPRHIVHKNMLTPSNATKEFGHSSLDYYGGYKSLISYNWHFTGVKNKVIPEIMYTENEFAKTIEVSVDGSSKNVELNTSVFSIVKADNNTVKWGNIHKAKGQGVFGFVPFENKGLVDTSDKSLNWELANDFKYGEVQEMNLSERSSILFIQEIESTRDQNIAVEIGSGNAVYILLNGEYITAHFSPERIGYEKEIVLLPLKKGKNQLTVKYFNRYEKSLKYSIRPLTEWKIFKQKLPEFELNGENIHRLMIRLSNPDSKVSPLRLNNINLKF